MSSSPPDPVPRRLAVALVAVLFGCTLGAAEDTPSFAGATAQYEAGKYAEAARAFEAASPQTVNGLYNAGTAWAKAGEPGLAALAFERVLLASPGHFEARHNLGQLRTDAGIPATAQKWWSRVPADLPPLTAAFAGWVALVSATALWIIGVRGPLHRWAGWAGAVGLAIFAAALPLWIVNGKGAKDPRAAVVITPKPVPARFAPARNAGVAATLAPGQPVRILSEAAGWAYCALGQQTRGWVPDTEVLRIRPLTQQPAR
jgi:tetratricopeptide (TPR) repeat protein